MARLRFSNLSSLPAPQVTVTLTASGNSVTFSADPKFPTFGPPDIMAISIEPDTASEEIIFITGWTAGQTSGPCVRAAEVNRMGSQVPISHTAASWAHSPTGFGDFKSPASRGFTRTYMR